MAHVLIVLVTKFYGYSKLLIFIMFEGLRLKHFHVDLNVKIIFRIYAPQLWTFLLPALWFPVFASVRNFYGLSHFQIASHPNLYVLDTPGVLAPEVLDVEMGSKLALTGTNLLCMYVYMSACIRVSTFRHHLHVQLAPPWGQSYDGFGLC